MLRIVSPLFLLYEPFSFPESNTETCRVVLTFESVDKILWCDRSNETSLTLLLQGTIRFSIFFQYFTKRNFGFFLNFDI